jgi:hypothetical protein
MKILKIYILVAGIGIFASCNNNAPKNETNPETTPAADSIPRDETRMEDPDIGGREMNNHGTDSLGQQTTGGK